MKRLLAMCLAILMAFSAPMEVLASEVSSEGILAELIAAEDEKLVEVVEDVEVSEKVEETESVVHTEIVTETEGVEVLEEALELERETEQTAPMEESEVIAENEVANAVEIVKSGTYTMRGANMTWQIDSNGKLTVEGTGATDTYGYPRWPWLSYADNIVQAEVNVVGSVRTDEFFENCSNLKKIDFKNFDTSDVTNMSRMFYNCSALTELDLSDWDVSNVTDISYMFGGCRALTELDLSGWNVSNVTDMLWLFENCSALMKLDLSDWVISDEISMYFIVADCKALEELDVSGWDVSSVTDMSGMFANGNALKKLDVSDWDTSNVTNMSCMFDGCRTLETLDVSGWDVSNVTNMSRMFYNCSALTELDVSGWNTSNVTDMRSMFYDCSTLTKLDVSSWNVSKVTNMCYMFDGCSSLQELDVNSWDVSNVTDMSSMFYDCSSLTKLDVSSWDVSSVTNMVCMFRGCSTLKELDVSGWDVSSVTDMSCMFLECSALSKLDVCGWDVSKVTDMGSIFRDCSALSKLDVRGWDVSNVTDMRNMFQNCNVLTELDISEWNVGNVANMAAMFVNCNALKELDLGDWNVGNVTSMGVMFKGCTALKELNVSGWNVGNVTGMGSMFENCSSLKNLDVSGWNVSNVTNMGCMFYQCSELTELDVSSWNVSNVTNMGCMFYQCSELTELDVSSWNVGNVTDMSFMFSNCSSLEKLDAGSWDVSKVTNMCAMFSKCSLLAELDVGSWNVSNVLDMSDMFAGCSALAELDVSDWNVSNVLDMNWMFAGCSALAELDVSDWNVANVTDMATIFNSCSSLKELDVSDWDISNVIDTSYMFNNCSSLKELDVSSWDVSNVTDVRRMFGGCNALKELDMSNWDMSNVTQADMFVSADALTTIYAPRNLKCSVTLSGGKNDKWYLSDGTVVTSLPQNTSHSRVIGKNYVPDASGDKIWIDDIVIEDATINGAGRTYVKFLLLDNKGNIQKETKVKYAFTNGSDAILSEDIQTVNSDANGYVILETPFLKNTTDTDKTLNLESRLWLVANGSEEELSYAVKVTVTIRPFMLDDIVVDGVTINGAGYTYVKFLLLNNSGDVQKETTVKYTFANSSNTVVAEDIQTATSDKDGYVVLKTALLQNDTGNDKTASMKGRLWLTDAKGRDEELLYKVMVGAIVQPLSFTQTWELGVAGTITGKASEGVGGKIGVAGAEAALAEAEIEGTGGGKLSVEHAFEGESRTLTLLQSYNTKIAAKASAGPAGKVNLLNHDAEVNVLKVGAGISAGGNAGIGLEIENYNPANLEHIWEVGKFMLASQAQASGNALLLILAEECGVDIYNLTQIGTAIAIEKGASAAAVKFNEKEVGSLASAESSHMLTYDFSNNENAGIKAHTFGYELLLKGGIGNIKGETPIGDIERSFFSDSIDMRVEISAESNAKDVVQKVALKKANKTSDGSILKVGVVDYVEVSYEGSELDKIKSDVKTLRDFMSGKTHYILGDAREELYRQLDQSSVIGTYTTGVEKQIIVEPNFELELKAGLGLEAGIGLEGVHSYTYETANGTYTLGERNITSRNDIDSLVAKKNAQYNIVTLIGEPLVEAAKKAKSFLTEVYGSVKDGVEAAYAELKQKSEEFVDGIKWKLYLVFVGEEETAEFISYEVSAYYLSDTSALAENTDAEIKEHKVYTVGSPYYLYVTDEDGTEVTDYTSNPLELTLKYTDAMLEKAGMSEESLEKLAIYRHSSELCGYVYVGGELDITNKCVTVTVTEPGQYVLAADEKEPTVTKIRVELDKNVPTIIVGFDEDCGFREFSLKVDETEYVGSDEWKQYYSANKRELVYTLENGVEDGNHTVGIYAVDSAGNQMAMPVTYTFEVDTKAPVMRDLTLTVEDDILSITVMSDDTDVESVTATITQAMTDETTTETTCVLTKQDTTYTSQIEVDKDATAVAVSVVAVDVVGNESEVVSETVVIDRIIDGLWYKFVDGSGEDDSVYTYTGSAIKPKVEIYDRDTLLVEKKDYTLSYSKNLNAGTGTITVTGKGNYAQKTTINFTIQPKDISDITDESIVVSELIAVVDKKVQKPVPTIKYNKKKLSNSKNKDITVTYPDTQEGAYKEAGVYTIHVEGNGNYTGERDITFLIGGKKTSSLSVSKIKSVEYTGNAYTPEIVVKDGKKELVKDEHYTVAYKNNTNIGTASVIITGISPAYVGTKTVTFKITGISIGKAKISGIPKSVEYNGQAHEPELLMTYKEESLQKDVDYTVSYTKNTKAGTATIVITGIGRFTGTMKKTFKINAFNVAVDEAGRISVQENMSLVYAKGGVKPQPVVKFGDEMLVLGTDYTLAYSNNNAVTTEATKKMPTVTVKFKGNYKGSVKKEFTILPQALDVLTITSVDKVVSTKKNQWKSTVSIIDLNGKKLVSGTDYEKGLEYYLDKECTQKADAATYGAGTIIWIKVIGKKNYAGSEVVVSYRITQQSITKAKAKITDQIYNGNPITIGADQIESVKVGKDTLILGEHFEIVEDSYKNNIKKGTASVQLRGIGNYGGTVTVNFKIKQKAFEWKTLLALFGL